MVHLGVEQETVTSFPPFIGVAVKVYSVQGPPLLGEVAIDVADVGEVAMADTSHEELRCQQGMHGDTR